MRPGADLERSEVNLMSNEASTHGSTVRWQSVDDIEQGPFSPEIAPIEMMTRMTTSQWLATTLNKIYAGESSGFSDTDIGISLRVLRNPQGLPRGNFEEYIKTISRLGGPESHDLDGSLWIWIQTEWLTDAQLLGTLAYKWNDYHAYVMRKYELKVAATRMLELVTMAGNQIARMSATRQMATTGVQAVMEDVQPPRAPRRDDPPVYDDFEEEGEWEGMEEQGSTKL